MTGADEIDPGKIDRETRRNHISFATMSQAISGNEANVKAGGNFNFLFENHPVLENHPALLLTKTVLSAHQYY